MPSCASVRCQPDDRQARDAAAGGGWPGPARTGPRQLRRQTATASADQPADDVQPGDASDGPGAELPGAPATDAAGVVRGEQPISGSRPANRSSTYDGCGWPTRAHRPGVDRPHRCQRRRGHGRRPGPRLPPRALGQAGFVLRRGTGEIFAAAATSDEAGLLQIRTGDPLLVERRVIVDSHGRRIEATESRYRRSALRALVHFDVEVPTRRAEVQRPGIASNVRSMSSSRRIVAALTTPRNRSPNSAVDPRPSPQVPDCVAR